MNTIARAKLAAKRIVAPEDKKIKCNFCGIIFLKLEPDHSEKNMCPLCGSVSRERVVYSAILNEYGDAKGVYKGNPKLANLRVIEFSPRSYSERLDYYKKTHRQYVATDYDLSAHTGDMKVDITNAKDIKPLIGKFDVAIFTHVLEHIPNYKSAIENLRKIMAKNGVVILQVPVLEKGYTKVTWEEYHGDNTKVYHRFGFDLAEDLAKYFDVTTYLGLLDFKISSPEIDPAKYNYLRSKNAKVHQFGNELMKKYGLGSPDLCEAFVLRAV